MPMNKSFAIFDMDGTLVDSMAFWCRLPREYLDSKGIHQIPADVLEQIKPLTMSQSAQLFARRFDLGGTAEAIAGEMNQMMEIHYRRDIPLKPGVKEYLEGLKAKEIAMCVASATAKSLMEVCLARLGIRDCFSFLLSCEEVGAGKERPDVYLEAARRLGCAPREAAVYEDALYAAATAKQAGFYVVAVYERMAAERWEELKKLADEAIRVF